MIADHHASNFGADAERSVDEWISILRISHRWEFSSIHALALRNLKPVASPVDKIVCARTLGAEEWLVGAYTALCTRVEPLTLDEGLRLGSAALPRDREGLSAEEILRLGIREVTCLNEARDVPDW